ncbi:hypothetical protein [Thalassoporum mexicanum]|nr:hypothetical protein [Pseudanabaena sp. PCC 7367]
MVSLDLFDFFDLQGNLIARRSSLRQRDNRARSRRLTATRNIA